MAVLALVFLLASLFFALLRAVKKQKENERLSVCFVSTVYVQAPLAKGYQRTC